MGTRMGAMFARFPCAYWITDETVQAMRKLHRISPDSIHIRPVYETPKNQLGRSSHRSNNVLRSKRRDALMSAMI